MAKRKNPEGEQELPHSESENEKKIPIITIDLSQSWDTESMAEIVLDELNRRHLITDDSLFCGFDAQDLSTITTRTSFFATTIEGLKGNEVYGSQNPFDYALKHKNSGIAIYDGTKVNEVSSFEYHMNKNIKPRDALIAVILLKGLPYD